ncbi:hypothetical protein GQ53DRAFT_496253 [Thozetella sp. PMI_491]|nr:hypothetical protein GQ53DRAFT_496253 [Thozetella sp. PMI_491]
MVIESVSIMRSGRDIWCFLQMPGSLRTSRLKQGPICGNKYLDRAREGRRSLCWVFGCWPTLSDGHPCFFLAFWSQAMIGQRSGAARRAISRRRRCETGAGQARCQLSLFGRLEGGMVVARGRLGEERGLRRLSGQCVRPSSWRKVEEDED